MNQPRYTFNNILSLREILETKTIIKFGQRIPNAQALLLILYKRPVVSVSDVMDELNVSKQTANTLTNEFVNEGILKERTGFSRNRIFVFEQYLNLFRR